MDTLETARRLMPPDDWELDVARVVAISQATPELSIIVDGNAGFSRSQAHKFLGGVGDMHGARSEEQRLTPGREERNVGRVRKHCRLEPGNGFQLHGRNLEDMFDRHARFNRRDRSSHISADRASEARRTLIRDNNKVVQRAVLQSPRLTDQEVEAFASMTNLTDEILRLIGKNRNFRKNYNVVRNLLNNGKAHLDISLNLLPMLNPTDLKKLGMNKNIPETLRATAVKLMRQRSETKK